MCVTWQRQWQAKAGPICTRKHRSKPGEEVNLGLGALRKDVQVGVEALAVVPSTHLEGEPEGLDRHDGVDVVTLPVHSLYLLVSELLDTVCPFSVKCSENLLSHYK